MKGIYKDLTGQTFGRLTAERQADKINRRIVWICKCSCGNVTNVLAQSLISHATKSCGCLHNEIISNDLVGKTFGRWEVIGESKKRASNGYKYWTCRCDCGIVNEVSGESLLIGRSTQCYACGRKSMQKQLCIEGHDTHIWGRT